MKKITRRSFLDIVGATGALGALSACGASTSTTTTSTDADSDASTPVAIIDPDDPYHITDVPVTFNVVCGLDANMSNMTDSEFYKMIEEKTNVHINWIGYDTAIIQEKVSLLLSSSGLPDAFLGNKATITLATSKKLGNEGTLIPLEDLISEYAPHMQQCMDENPMIFAQLASEEAHLYNFFCVEENNKIMAMPKTEMFINTDWLARVGKQKPTTTDEFYDVLTAFKTECSSSEIPFCYNPNYKMGSYFSGAFNALANARIISTSSMCLNFDGSKTIGENYSAVCISDNYKEYTKYMHTLFTEGLIDQEAYTHDQVSYLGKSATDTYCAFSGWGGYNEVGTVNLGGVDGFTGKYEPVQCIAGPDGTVSCENNYVGLVSGCGSITETCQYPEILVRWLDLFFNKDQCSDLIVQASGGMLGVTKTFNEETRLYDNLPTPEELTWTQFRWLHNQINMPWWNSSDMVALCSVSDEEKFTTSTIYDYGYYDAAIKNAPVLTLPLTDTENDFLSMEGQDLDSYITEYLAKCITGQVDIDATWDEYVSSAKQLKLDEVVQIYNDAYTRLMSLA